MTARVDFLWLLSDFESDSIGGAGVSFGGTGLNRCRYLPELWQSIVEELLVAFAEIALAALAVIA